MIGAESMWEYVGDEELGTQNWRNWIKIICMEIMLENLTSKCGLNYSDLNKSKIIITLELDYFVYKFPS